MTLGILYIYKYIPKNAAASGFSQIKNHQLVMEKQDAEQQLHGMASTATSSHGKRNGQWPCREELAEEQGDFSVDQSPATSLFRLSLGINTLAMLYVVLTVCLISCLSMLTPSINALLIKPLQMGQQQQLDMSLIRLSPSADQINQCNFLINTIYFFHKVGQSRVSIISI